MPQVLHISHIIISNASHGLCTINNVKNSSNCKEFCPSVNLLVPSRYFWSGGVLVMIWFAS